MMSSVTHQETSRVSDSRWSGFIAWTTSGPSGLVCYTS